ncbi:MAG: PrsW family intramembrane metalloprotease [Chloroflexi bacterium]|nr:PrsW family intramembrane metalloprotease [Chloroflexota bacterium]
MNDQTPSLAEPIDATPAPVATTHPSARDYVLAIIIALVGALFGIVGAFIQELRGGGLFVPFVAGPIIEEAVKPTGVYYLQARKPHLLRSQRFTAMLSGLSGLVFGLVESTIYVFVYISQPGHGIIIFRYTVDVALHTVCSFIVGLGINQRLIDSAEGKVPFLDGSRRYYITAIAIHAVFNITVTVLSLTDTWNFK